MSKNIMHIECDGHHYKVVPVEGTDGVYSVIKDGRRTKRITHDELFVDGDLIDIANWFEIA
jgi:hypothetical protein